MKIEEKLYTLRWKHDKQTHIKITRADVDASQGEESNESAYAELVEFVRVGVQLLFEELAAARAPGAPAAAPLH